MSSRFRFNGYAIGAAGHISEPFSRTIEVQAATALPSFGGRGVSRVVNFESEGLLRFDHLSSEITGSECECKDGGWSAVTHTKVCLEGLDILCMLTADRIVANVVSTWSPAGGYSVKLVGTRFENLRIAGIPVKVDLATDILDKYDTHQALTDAWSNEEEVRQLLERLAGRHVTGAPGKIQRWFSKATPEMPRNMSLVCGLEPESNGLKHWGHVVHVPGFATIRLPELVVSPGSRELTMLHVCLDCPRKGKVVMMSVGGSPQPVGQFDGGGDSASA